MKVPWIEEYLVRWRLCFSVVAQGGPPSKGHEGEKGGELCHSGQEGTCRSNAGAEDLRSTSIWDGEPGQGRERKGQSNGTNCFQSWVRQVAGGCGAKEGHF